VVVAFCSCSPLDKICVISLTKSISASNTSGASLRNRRINYASFRGGGGLLFFSAMQTSRTESAIVLDCATAEAVLSAATSASCYDQIENIRVLSIVKPELKFIQVQRQICLADFVVTPHDSALKQTTERFDRIGVSGAEPLLPLLPSSSVSSTRQRPQLSNHGQPASAMRSFESPVTKAHHWFMLQPTSIPLRQKSASIDAATSRGAKLGAA
jgi:hypothetical protein